MITLTNNTTSGEPLEAIFIPEKGMNMVSYKRGGVQVIDQSTKNLFEERFAGLGALIGPHFHHRNSAIIPAIKDESLFPHIARVKAKGVIEPFSHGIARYAPWKATATSNKVTAVISGKDQWNGVPLAALEGQNFMMRFQAELHSDGLHLELSVVSDFDSLAGIHYYYHLPKGRGTVYSQVKESADSQHQLIYPLDKNTDLTFHPFPDPLNGEILLDAIDYRLKTIYTCASQENCWQLYHPQEASFVCIEPISSQDPRHPNLTVSSIRIILQIEC